MFDYASIPIEHEYSEDHKTISNQDVLKLARGILVQSFADLRSKVHRGEALAWIMSDEDGYLFSFRNVSSLLGLDPAKVRRGIMSLIQNDGRKIKPVDPAHIVMAGLPSRMPTYKPF